MRQPAPTSTTAPPSSSSNPTSSSDPSTKKRRAEDELPDSPTRPSKIPTVDESIRNNPGLNSALPNGPQRFNNQNANGDGQQYQLSEMFGTGEGQLRKGMCVNYHREWIRRDLSRKGGQGERKLVPKELLLWEILASLL